MSHSEFAKWTAFLEYEIERNNLAEKNSSKKGKTSTFYI